jgi:hypothetical protein
MIETTINVVGIIKNKDKNSIHSLIIQDYANDSHFGKGCDPFFRYNALAFIERLLWQAN